VASAKGWPLRYRYSQFWKLLCAKLYLEVDDLLSSEGFEVVKSIVDLLVVFSQQPLVNIRDTATEASMMICQQLKEARVATRNQLAVAQRQRAAEQQRLLTESSGKNKTSQRLTAAEKELKRSSEGLARTDELISHIFGSIFVHRYKDNHGDVRTHSIRHLGLWMQADPVGMIKDEYLKYIGWSCAESDNHTRYETVSVLYNIIDVSIHLTFY
jgi:hypothetical protein